MQFDDFLCKSDFFKTFLQELRYPWYHFRWIHGTELIRYFKQL